jgi:hypothetical protein
MPTLITGPKGQLYADPTFSPDETKFQIDNTSGAYYSSVYYKLHKSLVQPIPPARNTDPLRLEDYLPTDIVAAINKAGSITFHAVGDTGAAKTKTQSPATAILHEGRVADAMANDVTKGGPNAPAFFFHLGDVIYEFGEAQYYYDQFYEPFRNYDRPIFGIPGNHDGMAFGANSSAPQVPTLAAFLTNFCSPVPGPSPDSPVSSRSVMTQPGVFFALDAPFVTLIGLYSNVIDAGPGVISSQNGHYPLVNDQLDFLTQQLTRLKPLRESMKRAVIIATHHPPLSVDSKHGGSTGMMQDIDGCCQNAGLWPDVVLSGHAHLYQHFTRMKNGRQVPYVVSGSGGYAATRPMGRLPNPPITVGDHTLEKQPIVDYGYLTITTDAKTLTITFKTADQTGVNVRDTIELDLKTGKIAGSAAPAAARAAGSPPQHPAKKTKKTKK